jgi:hypothetical protein
MDRNSDWTGGLFCVAGGLYCLVLMARDFLAGSGWVYYSGALLLAGAGLLALGGWLVVRAANGPRQ